MLTKTSEKSDSDALVSAVQLKPSMQNSISTALSSAEKIIGWILTHILTVETDNCWIPYDYSSLTLNEETIIACSCLFTRHDKVCNLKMHCLNIRIAYQSCKIVPKFHSESRHSMELLMKSKEQSKAELGETYKILKESHSCNLSHPENHQIPELKQNTKTLTYEYFENIIHYVSVHLENSSLAKSLFILSSDSTTFLRSVLGIRSL